MFNEFRKLLSDKNLKTDNIKKDSGTIFKEIGEWVNIDYESVLDKEMGFRGSNVPHLPEKVLSDDSSLYEIIDESKKYNNLDDLKASNNITPYGLLVMTRMLFKYKKNNAQWLRVATVLELIYKYLGNSQTREQYFESKYNISITALMELEEFYNTNHIFMSEQELESFKSELRFYKQSVINDVNKEIKKLRK